MIVNIPEPPFQEADIISRPKDSGLGEHYGTIVRTALLLPPNALPSLSPKFMVAHTMPDTGKTVTTIDEFSKGRQFRISRQNRTPEERLAVELAATSDLGRPYAALDNCETDTNRVQFGIATSPTGNLLSGVAIVVGGFVAGAFLSDRN